MLDNVNRRAIVNKIIAGGGFVGAAMLASCGPNGENNSVSQTSTIKPKLNTSGPTVPTPLPIINAADYGAVTNPSSIATNTQNLQDFFDACKGNIGYIPNGIYPHNGLTFDPTANYIIFGAGIHPSGTTGTTLKKVGSGHNLSCDSHLPNYPDDNQIMLADMNLVGEQSSGDGIHFTNVTRLRLYRLNITTNGGHGIYLSECWAGLIDTCTVSQNGQHGIYLAKSCNQFNILNCIVNSNSRKDSYANLAIVGTSGGENLGVNIHGCDWSYAGSNNDWGTNAQAIGLLVQNTYSANIEGNYAEAGRLYTTYIGGNTKGVRFNGNYLQDGANLVQTSENAEICRNIFRNESATTSLTVDTVAPSVAKVEGNLKIGTVSFSFPGSSAQFTESYGSAPPTTGTFELGHKVINKTPSAGGYLGWVCVTAGTPGTWKGFGVIAT